MEVYFSLFFFFEIFNKLLPCSENKNFKSGSTLESVTSQFCNQIHYANWVKILVIFSSSKWQFNYTLRQYELTAISFFFLQNIKS